MDKPHAVCIPYPAQGHINPMLKVAKLLHSRGFHITFVNTEFNHRRLLRSRGPSSLDGLPDFHFETIPDGLPQPADLDATQDIPTLCESTQKNCLSPFRDLVARLNAAAAVAQPVTCIVSDLIMSFSLDVAEELRIPVALFWTASAIGFLAYLHYKELVNRGIVPLKDVADLSNGYLDTTIIDWVPGMIKNMRLRDFPSFIRTTDPNEFMINYAMTEISRSPRASAIVINTFDGLDCEILTALSSMLTPSIYAVGPLPALSPEKKLLPSIGSNLWTEEEGCLGWLEGRAPRSVVYVNFGSITVMTNQQLVEFAWGLAGSRHDFLWVIRPDLVRGDSAVLPEEFLAEIGGRGFLAGWCPQEQVLSHPSIGGFLTHSGWNSTLESMFNGVPMICWPFFAEQQTNCRYVCVEWGIGMEIHGDVEREGVKELVVELMDGEKGKEMRRRASEWKESAVRATLPGGASLVNLDRFVDEVLLSKQQ